MNLNWLIRILFKKQIEERNRRGQAEFDEMHRAWVAAGRPESTTKKEMSK